MKLNTFISKTLGKMRDAENQGESISELDVVAWKDDELVDVWGIALVQYDVNGPLFLEIDTVPREDYNPKG